MKYVGAHVSAVGGVENAPVNAHEIGAKAFALFTRNQRQWKSQPLKADSIHLFKERCEAYGYDPGCILTHDSYWGTQTPRDCRNPVTLFWTR